MVTVKLTTKQRKVLFALQNLDPFSLQRLAEIAGIGDDAETKSVLMELFYMDLVGGISSNHLNEIVSVRLSDRGRNYKELLRLERCERWKERGIGFVSGVVASLVAAAVAYFTGIA